MVMMLPLPCAVMRGAACFMPSITPRTCTAKTLSQCAASVSAIPLITPGLPALFTRQSSRPNRSSACRTRAATSRSSVTSVGKKLAAAPICLATPSPSATRLAAITTEAPLDANN